MEVRIKTNKYIITINKDKRIKNDLHKKNSAKIAEQVREHSAFTLLSADDDPAVREAVRIQASIERLERERQQRPSVGFSLFLENSNRKCAAAFTLAT